MSEKLDPQISVHINDTIVNDTIVACATPPGRAGVAVIRASGPQCTRLIKDICGRSHLRPRLMNLVTFSHPDTQESLDRGLVVYFPAPNSFTGEDVLEFHVHGSPAVVHDLMTAMIHYPDIRLAEPGEFSKRAFYNNKMDLTELEGLGDLLAAQTAFQRRQALQQMSGSLSTMIESWRSLMIDLMAHTEAYIDFPDEDIPDNVMDHRKQKTNELIQSIDLVLGGYKMGERIRQGFNIVLAGLPNVGKSTLLNMLAKRDIAIVSEYAGTTRDILEVHLDLQGFSVTIFDTAGIRESDDPIEQEGIKRTLARIKTADLILWMVDGQDERHDLLKPFCVDHCSELAGTSIKDIDVMWIVSKSDLLGTERTHATKSRQNEDGQNIQGPFYVSAKTGEGVGLLLDHIYQSLLKWIPQGHSPMINREHHRQSLELAKQSLIQSLGEQHPELIAEHLRYASHALSVLTGRIGVDTLLDKIFKEFCIGK